MSDDWKPLADRVLPALAAMLQLWQGRRLLGGRDEVDIGADASTIRAGFLAVLGRAEKAEARIAELERERDTATTDLFDSREEWRQRAERAERERDEARAELRAAATSLESIANEGGRSPSLMTMADVRAFAAIRFGVARAALAEDA